jgi:alkaline phosphatase D
MSWAFVLLGVAPSGLSPAAPIRDAGPLGLLVTTSEVTASAATLWVRAHDGEPVRIRYAPEREPGDTRVAGARPAEERDFTATVRLDGLAPGTRYAYEVEHGVQRIRGRFVTAPDPTTDSPVRLAWSGDLGGGGFCRDVEDGYPIFRALTERGPDLFLFVGDTIYADQVCGRGPHVPGADFVATSLDEYRSKHRYNRSDRAVQEFFRTTTVYATWDDHEVRNNFAGPYEPLMPVARRAFLDYWPVKGPPDEPARLYRSVRWGLHVEIFILDTRQYRSSNWEPDGPAKTMLGAAQRDWLLDGVLRSDATWKLVVSSVPLGMFTGGRAADSWSSANVLGYPRTSGTGFVHERDAILRALREHRVGNVVFLSGDVHHAELVRHDLGSDYSIHEFVAGPLAARQGYRRFLDRSLASRSLGSLGFANNFGELVADGAALDTRILDASGTVRVSYRLPARF